MAGLLLNVRNLNAGYGRAEVLHGLTLTASAGKVITVIGPNGAGKSTLLNALMGALRRRERSSTTAVGRRCSRWRSGHAGMALVPETRALFGAMSVEDNLLLGAWRQFGSHQGQRQELNSVYMLFPRLPSGHPARRTLSGGERQMLGRRPGADGQPSLLMLDEPSLGSRRWWAQHLRHHRRAAFDRRHHPPGRARRARRSRVADYGYVLEMGEVALQARPKTWPRIRG